MTIYLIHNIIRETERELLKKIENYLEFNLNKNSFIGKIDKIENDFNNYFYKTNSFKNNSIDQNELELPEYYLQTIINRKRPETAIPCNLRTKRKSSFKEENNINSNRNRIKTSINKRENMHNSLVFDNDLNEYENKKENKYFQNFNNNINNNSDNEFNDFENGIQEQIQINKNMNNLHISDNKNINK